MRRPVPGSEAYKSVDGDDDNDNTKVSLEDFLYIFNSLVYSGKEFLFLETRVGFIP